MNEALHPEPERRSEIAAEIAYRAHEIHVLMDSVAGEVSGLTGDCDRAHALISIAERLAGDLEKVAISNLVNVGATMCSTGQPSEATMQKPMICPRAPTSGCSAEIRAT